MLNFAVDPGLLSSYVPFEVELDFHKGETYLSLVGFLFYHTLVPGLPIPRHRNFEKVDLRFYVRKKSAERWRRGIVSLRELVPRSAIEVTAKIFPGEPYQALSMRSQVTDDEAGVSSAYEWRWGKKWEGLCIRSLGRSQSVPAGSHEDFITGRDWSYTKREGLTTEYQIKHPRWRIWPADHFDFNADAAMLCGDQFVEPLNAKPVSAFIADGSFVEVLART